MYYQTTKTVLLSVDQVVGGHREMVEVERRCAEEVEKVEDQTMTSANETWCARMTKQLIILLGTNSLHTESGTRS